MRFAFGPPDGAEVFKHSRTPPRASQFDFWEACYLKFLAKLLISLVSAVGIEPTTL